MAQGRIINKKISLSEKLADLKTDSARLLYTWMIPHTDDIGLLQNSPRTIKGIAVPMLDWTVEDIGNHLEEMKKVGLIKIIFYKGKEFIYIVDSEKNQSLKKDRQPFTLLEFSFEKKGKDSWIAIEKLMVELVGKHLEDKGFQLESEEKGKEGKGKEEKGKEDKFPLAYLSNIPENDLEEFTKKFKCNITQVKSKANDVIDWVSANGKKKKDYKATLRTWLRKDFGERPAEQPSLNPDVVAPELSEDERLENRKRIAEIKKNSRLKSL